MTDTKILKIGKQKIGRAGLVCTLCRTSLTAKQVHQIAPPQNSGFYGFSPKITVCNVCKENN